MGGVGRMGRIRKKKYILFTYYFLLITYYLNQGWGEWVMVFTQMVSLGMGGMGRMGRMAEWEEWGEWVEYCISS